MILTKRHYTRLRHYFAGKTNGSASVTDTIDIDLISLKYIKRLEKTGLPYFIITSLGENELLQERQREIKRRNVHHDLASRLSQHLRNNEKITWENIEFIVDMVNDLGENIKYAARPDVFSMTPTYNADKMNPCIYEVKVSRSDFLTDVNKPEKRKAYQNISEQMYYVCAENLVKIEEVPIECGLIYEFPNGEFKIIKKIKKKKIVLTPRHFMNLILKKGQFNSFND